MAGERILIVEDEYLIRATVSEMLEDHGYEVIAADNGEEALDMLRSDGGVAILITDMSLAGGMDGRTLAAAARGLRGALPVIFMTGRPESIGPLDPATDAVVAKPYTSAELVAAITKFLPPTSHQ
jgi:CheY-like chemotaxis protein